MNKDILLLAMEFIIRLVIIAIVPVGVSYVRKYNLQKYISTVVLAAEQLFKKTDPDGTKRKTWVKENILNRFKIDPIDLDILIEAAVKELNILESKALE